MLEGIDVVENAHINGDWMWDPFNPNRLLVKNLEDFKKKLKERENGNCRA